VGGTAVDPRAENAGVCDVGPGVCPSGWGGTKEKGGGAPCVVGTVVVEGEETRMAGTAGEAVVDCCCAGGARGVVENGDAPASGVDPRMDGVGKSPAGLARAEVACAGEVDVAGLGAAGAVLPRNGGAGGSAGAGCCVAGKTEGVLVKLVSLRKPKGFDGSVGLARAKGEVVVCPV
jgi:hypothetical protein